MGKKLVIFTKKFGSNFTGATLATINIASRLQLNYDEIIVVAKEVGIHNFTNIQIIRYSNLFQAYKILKKLDPNYDYYSDDHFGYLLGLTGKRYLHTYHGNWPDAMFADFKMFIYAFYFIPQYIATIKSAKVVANVSFYMEKFVRRFNANTVVIRNGIGHESVITNLQTKQSNPIKIIMIGNIDNRKYKYAIKLFEKIENSELKSNVIISIFGNVHDQKILRVLEKFSFITLKGFSSNINFSEYDLCLSTSLMENLSISSCEAVLNKLPVIAFNVGGTNEIIDNYVNGILLPRKDTKSMFIALKKVIDHNIDFDLNNNHSLLSNFNWDFAVKRYRNILNSL